MNMRDIVPYTHEEAQSLAITMVNIHVPTLGSPQLSIRMMSAADKISAFIKDMGTDLSPGMVGVLEGFRLRIMDVALVNGFMCGSVINKLQEWIEANENPTPPPTL